MILLCKYRFPKKIFSKIMQLFWELRFSCKQRGQNISIISSQLYQWRFCYAHKYALRLISNMWGLMQLPLNTMPLTSILSILHFCSILVKWDKAILLVGKKVWSNGKFYINIYNVWTLKSLCVTIISACTNTCQAYTTR